MEHHPSLVGAWLCALLLAACTAFAPDLSDLAQDLGLSGSAIVRLSESEAVAAKLDGSQVEVYEFTLTDDGWHSKQVATGPSAPEGSGNLVGSGSEDGLERSLFFGSAPSDVSRVDVEGATGTGGDVIDGAWVIVFPSEVAPDQLTWTMVDPFGAEVRSGDGLFP